MTSYSIDILYAYIHLGLDAPASSEDIQGVLANATAYRHCTKERLKSVQYFVSFFTARAKLGDPEMSFADIRKSYHKKAMRFHPDRNRGNQASEEELKIINSAFEVVEAVYREAKDYFKQSEQTQREIEQEARKARERETPIKSERRERRAAEKEDQTSENTRSSNPGKNRNRAKTQTKDSGAQASVKYMAASVPRHIRVARLSHVRLNSVIGSWFVNNEKGSNYVFDVLMLSEKEFMRARTYLGAPAIANPALEAGRFAPPYVLKDTKEVSVPANELDPESYAKAHFVKEFNLAGA